MYIDKLYTKLFSDKNWEGLRQLREEVHAFAMSDRDEAAMKAKIKLARRGHLARYNDYDKYDNRYKIL